MTRSTLIIRRELRAFFGTWSGYVIAALALLIEGLLFNAFALGSKPKFSAEVLSSFFYFSSGITMVAALFLAMRLIAEEKQAGTIVLFFTSPVSERELVYGKFLSAFIFLTIIHIISLYMPVLILINGKISLGHLAAGYLGLSLIGAATLALALFCSAIASGQLLAGILATCLLVTMLIMWILSGVVEEPFKGLFSYLALHNDHFNPFSKGMVNTKHIIYYLSVIVFFLEASVRVLKVRRWQG